MLLLRPGASADWALDGLPAGSYRLTLSLEFLAGEGDIVLGGAVLGVGVVPVRIPETGSSGAAETREVTLDLKLEHEAKNLKLEASAGASGPVYLRLRSLSLTPVEKGAQATESC